MYARCSRRRRPDTLIPTRGRAVSRTSWDAHHDDQRHKRVNLGAWGCGVFKNDPTEIAGHFAAALGRSFQSIFATVIFAVLDTSPERRFIGPFERVFHP